MSWKVWTPTELGLSAIALSTNTTTTGNRISGLLEYDHFLLLVYLNAGANFPSAANSARLRAVPVFTEGAGPVDGPDIYFGVANVGLYTQWRNPVGWMWGEAGGFGGDYGVLPVAAAGASAPNLHMIDSLKFVFQVTDATSGVGTASARLYAKGKH